MNNDLLNLIGISERKIEKIEAKKQDGRISAFDRLELEYCKNTLKYLMTLAILKKYIYYSNKSHCFRMREIRKSTQNFDYEDLKEVIGDAIIPKQ